MKENKKLILSIIAVALIIVLIGGGTYAYWQWTSANNTSVTFTVTGGTMTIDGGGNITTTAKLAPASCYNTKYAIQRKIKVTASNDTTTNMVETIQLKVNTLSTTSGTLNSTNKASLQWALVRSNETQHAASTWILTSQDACEAAAATTNLETKGTMLGEGTFSAISTNSVITLYNKDIAPAKTSQTATAVSTTDYYELYIWIDPDYTGTTTTGTTVADPLQDLTLKLVWQGTMTNQIS